MTYYTDTAAGNNVLSPGAQAAVAAAAMSFTMDQKNNNSRQGAQTTTSSPAYRPRRQPQQQPQLQTQQHAYPYPFLHPHTHSPSPSQQQLQQQPYTPKLSTDVPAFPPKDTHQDLANRSPTNRHYRPPQQQLRSPSPAVVSSSASSIMTVSASTLSPSQNNKNLWNDLNQSSSTTALAAAASIAKQNPSSLISNSTSPKLIRKPVPSVKHSMIHSTLRKSPQQHSSIASTSMQRFSSTSSVVPSNSIRVDDNRPPSAGARKQLPRKPPPPPRTLTNENMKTGVDVIPAALPATDKSFDYDRSNVSSFQFPMQHNSYATQSNISVPYPHSKNSSPTSSPQSAQNGFHSSSELYVPEMHKRSLSKSQKLSNFLNPKSLKDEMKSQRLFNGQLSNSTSTLPSQIQQLSMNESTSFSNDVLDQPMTAPTMYALPNSSTDYFTQRQQPEDFYSNPNVSSSKMMMNNSNASNSNIYQQATGVPSHQLVFRTTLRNSEKRGGFGRSKKSKTEFNEDKPWKNHDRGNLNIVSAEEKKRYEGVFAANKGLYINLDLRLTADFKMKAVKVGDSITSEPERTLADFVNTYSSVSERIHGIVVREIWLRSRLDQDTLKKMWSLVLDDRKRRWIKCISSGNTEWLLVDEVEEEEEEEEGEGTEDVNLVDADGVTTVDNETLQRKDGVAEDGPIFKEGFTLDQQSDNNNLDTHAKQTKINNVAPGVVSQISGPAQPEDEFEDASEYNDPDTNINGKETQENEIDDILENTDQNKDQNPAVKSEKQSELPISGLQDSQRKKSDSTTYDLLDTDRNLFDDGTLTCDEFIVGMWLVDQCLYGRKIPKIVPITVWETIGVDWTVSAYGSYPHHIHHPHVPGMSDIVGIGIKKSKKAGKTKRQVLKKVIGI